MAGPCHLNFDSSQLTFIASQGSLLEYIDTINILQKSTTPSFHLICPNQIGYGWSSGPPLDRGFGMYDMARILDKLMVGLGFGSGYAVQVSHRIVLVLARRIWLAAG